MTESGDYAFIVGVIEYLSSRHGIRFFISSGDFDLLYNWWERGIPVAVMRSAMDRVVERRSRRRQAVTAFAQFRYEVRRQYAAWLERGIGGPSPQSPPAEDPVTVFMRRFPPELEPLRAQFRAAARERAQGRPVDPAALRRAVVELFREDQELEMRVRAFMQNLSPELRKDSVAAVYRANYLWNRLGIPDFDLPASEETGK